MSRTLAARRWIAVLLAGAATAAVVAVAPAQEETPVVRFEVERFVVEGDSPLSEAQTRAVLDPFTGEHAGVDGLLAAADALERAIRDVGVAFQRVVLPPQSLQDGEVVLRVAVFRVTGVEVRGAHTTPRRTSGVACRRCGRGRRPTPARSPASLRWRTASPGRPRP